MLCQQTWFPRQLNSKGKKTKHCRGYGLFGPQYMRLYGDSKTSVSSCCCNSEVCEKIGYSHEGMFRPPPDPIHCKEAVRVLGIKSPERRQKIVDDRRSYFVAPWHYKKEHRVRVGIDGNWEIKENGKVQGQRPR